MQDLVQNTVAKEILRRKDQFALTVENQGILQKNVTSYMVFHQDSSSEINPWQTKSLTIRWHVLGMSIMSKLVKNQAFYLHNAQSSSHSVSSF